MGFISDNYFYLLLNIVLIAIFIFYFFRASKQKLEINKKNSLEEELGLQFLSIKVAADEMITSTNEISKNSNIAAEMTSNSLRQSEEIEKIVEILSENSNDIGEIVKVVSSITQQTNMLALNASIEAERAGEAGRGFGVVANEVKELSRQTKSATKEISQKIDIIQKQIHKVQNSITEASQAIRDVNKLTQDIAGSVSKQTIFNEEIAKTIEETKLKLEKNKSA